MRKKGFTLIELLVVSAILLILLEAGYSFFINNYKMLQEEKKKAYIESQVKSFMDYTMQSLQMAYQEEIEIENSHGDNETKRLIIWIPNDNSKIDFSETDSTKISIYAKKNDEKYKICIEKGSYKQEILDGNISSFDITTKPETIDQNTILQYVQIDFKVDYKIRGIVRDYSIKYNIRR
ncbi:MAG: prepilin-type N-terminal cleavage/methylation protein [Caloramator sp.]|jgi:prepilin-type N-terminal cleavage/methylation domain-containing protein|uniref:prepilin-type N-terminal cleavage/methylation domain-containing protein n=1 Tax=Caloramator sp. TaxID=1871330 RepID=UPI001E167C99|nr:prepilin-type N-terminal cleavage/methylation domain-containing protein [Caloramator sp.]MBZ4664298.1 prepilin-type N-terminal cleavage/methylation protein [Caloramator sp.]